MLTVPVLLAGVAVTSLAGLMLNALALWAAARLFRVPEVRFRRAIVVALVIVAVILAVQGVCIWLGFGAMTDLLGARQPLAPAVIRGLLPLVVFWLVVKRGFRISRVRALGVAAVAWVLAAAANVGLALGIIWTACEAFVVPTGSMAPTICGIHADVACPDCGWEYAVGLSAWRGVPLAERQPIACACPNCGRPERLALGTPVVEGDRIVVDKTGRPRRWQLVVFWPPDEPSEAHVSRLVGLPGETIEIAEGDLFVNGRRLQKFAGQTPDLWLPVHDTDYPAPSTRPDAPRWAPVGEDSAWTQSETEWRCDAKGNRPQRLRFEGAIRDTSGYNDVWPPGGEDAPPWVGDVAVRCTLAEFAGRGSLTFRYVFRGQEVVAQVDTGGRVRLSAAGVTPREDAEDRANARLTFPPSGPHTIGFEVRDGLAQLAHRGNWVAWLGIRPDRIDEVRHGSPKPDGPCQLEIEAVNCRVAFPQIRVFRDVYYRNTDEMGPSALGGLVAQTGRPITLGPDDFFFLGDNSARSKDGRFFGPVSGDAVIGPARMIYWPLRRWRALP